MTAGAWMPLYIADYLADTSHLTTEEHGAYLLMIMHYWQVGSLPDDDAKLARICRLSLKKFKLMRSQLEALFGPQWVHRRVESERAKALKLRETRRAHALHQHSKSRASAPADAPQVHTQSQSQLPTDTSSLRSDAAVPAAPEEPIAKILFGSCLRYLTANGVVEKQARPLIGKWRRDFGDGEVAAAIAEAQKDAVSEPVGMVAAILQRRRGARPTGRVETRYSTASLAASILTDHENDNSVHEGRDGPPLQRAPFRGERGPSPLLLECDLQEPGPDEPE